MPCGNAMGHTLVFGDEASKDERTSNRRTGWSRRGTRCVQRKYFVHGKRFSLLPIIMLNGIIVHDIIEGSVTSEKFIEFLRELVVSFVIILSCTLLTSYFPQISLTNPYPGPCSVLILDNCRIHHAEEIQQLVEDEACALGVSLHFISEYSHLFQNAS